MICKKCRKLFSIYLDNDLNLTKRKAFEDHLAKCSACTSDLAKFKKVIASTSAIPAIQASVNFDISLKTNLEGIEIYSKKSPLRIRFAMSFGVVCLLLIIAFSFYLYRASNEKIHLLTGRESVPMITKNHSEQVLTNFVIPTTSASEYNIIQRDFVLPSVILMDTVDEKKYMLDEVILTNSSHSIWH